MGACLTANGWYFEKEIVKYRVLCERSTKQYQQIVREKIRNKLYVKLVAMLEIEGATSS